MSNNYHTMNNQQKDILREVAVNQQLLPNNDYVRHQNNMANHPGTPINQPQEENKPIELSETQPVIQSPQKIPQQVQPQVIQEKPKQIPQKKKSFDYYVPIILFVAFVFVVYPKTGKLVSKYIPLISESVPMKTILMRGILLVIIFLVLNFLKNMIVKDKKN